MSTIMGIENPEYLSFLTPHVMVCSSSNLTSVNSLKLIFSPFICVGSRARDRFVYVSLNSER